MLRLPSRSTLFPYTTLFRSIVGETGAGPVRSAIVRKIQTLFRASYDFTAVIWVHTNFANSVILWKLTRRLCVSHAKNVGAENGPCSSCISGLKNTLATHEKGTEIEIAGASINGVMIAGINRSTVDGCSGNQRIIGYHAPGSGITATVSRPPYTTADRTKISHNATIDSRGGINRDRVNSPFRRRVIETARATGHAFWLRSERDEAGGTERQWT